MDLTSTGSAQLCWWEWPDLYLYWDWGQVYANGEVVFEHCGGSYTAPTAWVQQCVDLSSHAGSMVDVEFHMMASTVVNYAGWYIDDIEIFHGSDCEQSMFDGAGCTQLCAQSGMSSIGCLAIWVDIALAAECPKPHR